MGEWQQLSRLYVTAAPAALEGSRDEPIGELGVLGERGSVEVCSHQVAVEASLRAVLTVVAGALEH